MGIKLLPDAATFFSFIYLNGKACENVLMRKG